MRWTKEDIEYLVKNYKDTDIKILSEHLGRKYGSIYRKASEINLTKVYKNYSWRDSQPETIDGEIWRKIDEFPKYKVSNLGRVKNDNNFLLKPYKQVNSNILSLKIRNNNKFKEVTVSRLVAKAFIPNPNNKPCVFHKDGDFKNNLADNLEWMDREEVGKLSGKLSNRVSVLKCDKNTGDILAEYDSISSAAKDNNVHKESIRCAVRGKQKTAAGFVWKEKK